MCRNITTLRGLQPEATTEEVEAAARQYVRKVSGVQSTSVQTEAAFEHGARVVDLGCGTGELTVRLHHHVGAVETVGIDRSAEMLERAQTLH